jgi:hypothetical protein
LDRIAARLEARAASVRQHAADHQRQGQAARWVSTAAQAYRDRVAEDRAEADRAADAMEHAAAVLRAHAQRVRERIALIARYEADALDWFARQARSLADGVENVIDSAGRVVEQLVAEAPWSTWPIGPQNLPAPGDMKWLEVGSFLRRQGVM